MSRSSHSEDRRWRRSFACLRSNSVDAATRARLSLAWCSQRPICPSKPSSRVSAFLLRAALDSVEVDRQNLAVFFSMFNVAMHRPDQMTADEAILLLRTVAAAASKMLNSTSAADTAPAPPPSTLFFENLAKAVYCEQELLSAVEFSSACQSNAVIAAFLAQWTQQDT